MKLSRLQLLTVLIITALLVSISMPVSAAPKKKPSKFSPSPTPTATATAVPTYTPTPNSTPLSTPSLTPSPTPTPVPTPSPTPAFTPTPTPQTKQVLGFTTYYYAGDMSSYNSMSNNLSSIDQIASATHITDGSGNIAGIVPSGQISLANNSGITPLVLVGNNFDGSIAKTLLESETNRRNFINNLLNIIKTNGYKGANIDIEGIYYYNRSQYTAFLGEVYSALKSSGYTVSVSVPGKTWDSPTNSWTGAYDYAAIANYADMVLLMTYDEHYPGGSPGPIASISWVTNVINYASSVIPKDKILLGVAAYGYDWAGSNTKAYSVNGCYNLAANNGASVLWDETSKCPYFTYKDSAGVSHTVWFENAQSIGYKLDLVNAKGIAGIGIWRLGLENADYWNMINAKL